MFTKRTKVINKTAARLFGLANPMLYSHFAKVSTREKRAYEILGKKQKLRILKEAYVYFEK